MFHVKHFILEKLNYVHLESRCMNNKTLNVLDTITLTTGVLGISISVQDIQTWLSILCTIVCLCSGIVTLIIRFVSLFKKYTSEDSEGGKNLTSSELEDLANELNNGIENIKKEGEGNGKESNK